MYGSCEGPDAMYVKLISSDGHEFIVKREHALMSGTIKAMLSGPGQFAENETNEIHFREIPWVLTVPICCYLYLPIIVTTGYRHMYIIALNISDCLFVNIYLTRKINNNIYL